MLNLLAKVFKPCFALTEEKVIAASVRNSTDFVCAFFKLWTLLIRKGVRSGVQMSCTVLAKM